MLKLTINSNDANYIVVLHSDQQVIPSFPHSYKHILLYDICME